MHVRIFYNLDEERAVLCSEKETRFSKEPIYFAWQQRHRELTTCEIYRVPLEKNNK